MIYPRIVSLNGKDELVSDNEMVTYREHMQQKHRLLYISGVITGETSAHDLLLALDTLSHEPIKLVITSAGGDLDSAFLLYDTMKLIKSPIETCGRYCASAAAMLLAAGSKRYLFPHCKIMLHLPAGQMGGDARDWEIQVKEMQKYKNRVVDILKECGVKKSREEILFDMDRDFWLTPKEAIEYGLADEIMTPEIWREWTTKNKKEEK